MNKEDSAVARNIALVVGALIAIAVVAFLATKILVSGENTGSQTIVADSKTGETRVLSTEEIVNERISRVGSVAVIDPSKAAAAGPKSAEDVYKGVCGACHTSGVAGAPKIGDKAAWSTRLATGMDALTVSVVNGKGAMPPKGGGADLSEAEITSAIAYMLTESGLDAPEGVSATPDGAATVTASTTEAVTEAVETTTAKVVAGTTVAIAAVTTAVTKAADTAASTVTETVAVAKEAVVETKEAVAEKAVEKVQQAAAAVDHSKGMAIYKDACFACHDSGVAGAPKIGDAAAWSARVGSGADVMYASAINGKGAMPPKGGRLNISDEDIKATVDYMISASQ